MTQPAKSQEPSMEEILASIRRIIADDDASKSVQRAAEPPKPAPRPAPPPRARCPNPSPNPSLACRKCTRTSCRPLSQRWLRLRRIRLPTFSISPSRWRPLSQLPAPAATPQFRKIDGFSDVSFDEAEPKAAMPRADDSGLRSGENGLLSSATSAAVDFAFNALAQTVLVQNARTLEDLVREMLRPMLKSWLDDNLPGMVERLVRAEIERVARGR